jgi:hypothetical protein
MKVQHHCCVSSQDLPKDLDNHRVQCCCWRTGRPYLVSDDPCDSEMPAAGSQTFSKERGPRRRVSVLPRSMAYVKPRGGQSTLSCLRVGSSSDPGQRVWARRRLICSLRAKACCNPAILGSPLRPRDTLARAGRPIAPLTSTR